MSIFSFKTQSRRKSLIFPAPIVVCGPSRAKKDYSVRGVAAEIAASRFAARKKHDSGVSYRLVLMPRDKAEKKAERKGVNCIILGSCDLSPFEIQNRILRYTTLPKVKGLEQLGALSSPSSSSGGGAVVSVRARYAARMGYPGGFGGVGLSRNRAYSKYYIPRKKQVSYNMVWVLVRPAFIAGIQLLQTAVEKMDELIGCNKPFCNFEFAKKDFQASEDYQSKWRYQSSNKNFHFTYNDAQNIKDAICDTSTDEHTIRQLIRDYLLLHQVNCAIEFHFEEDLNEFIDAVAYIMFHIFEAYFSGSDEPFGHYTPEQFKNLSYDDFREKDPLLSLCVEILRSYLPQANSQPVSTSPVYELPSVASTTEQMYCTYIVPGKAKSREEIEEDIERTSHKSAATFAHLLTSYKEQGFLDFRGESASDIYAYFKERYPHLSFGLKTFQEAFKAS